MKLVYVRCLLWRPVIIYLSILIFAITLTIVNLRLIQRNYTRQNVIPRQEEVWTPPQFLPANRSGWVFRTSTPGMLTVKHMEFKSSDGPDLYHTSSSFSSSFPSSSFGSSTLSHSPSTFSYYRTEPKSSPYLSPKVRKC